MIYIFCALYDEAHPWIEKYHLVREHDKFPFQVFYGGESDIRLTVTGMGSVAAAAAVSAVCTKYEVNRWDFLVNIGICDAKNSTFPADTIWLCNKITDQSTGKTFYPDMLYRHDFAENNITTTAADTEAAVYQSGSYFFEPQQMSFLEITSDGEISENSWNSLNDYLSNLQHVSWQEKEQNTIFSEEEMRKLNTLAEHLCCSAVMKEQLLQYARYAALAQIPYWNIIENLYVEGLLPCRSRKEGKQRLEELKQRLL
jgi:hypothetical protein